MAEVNNDYYSDLISNAVKSQGSNSFLTGATKELDKDAFLNLLVAEMSNQDPLNPMEDSDFIAQLAQFSALEQMENMNTTAMQSRGMELVGKTVIASTGADKFVTGVVGSVIYNSGKTYLDIEGAIVEIDNVREVFSGAVQIEPEPGDDTGAEGGTETDAVGGTEPAGGEGADEPDPPEEESA